MADEDEILRGVYPERSEGMTRLSNLGGWVSPSIKNCGSLVILSAAKDLALGKEMLRGVYPERSEWAQHDTTGFGR